MEQQRRHLQKVAFLLFRNFRVLDSPWQGTYTYFSTSLWYGEPYSGLNLRE
jgi:hypothetical protein